MSQRTTDSAAETEIAPAQECVSAREAAANLPAPMRVTWLLVLAAAIWLLQLPILRASADWPVWLSLDKGISGWLAGLSSTTLAIVFASQLFRSADRISRAAAYEPLGQELVEAMAEIRGSWVPVGLGIVGAVIAGLFLFRFWTSGVSGFTTIQWFATALPAVCVSVFALCYFLSCAVGLVVAVLGSKELGASVDLLCAEPEDSVRTLSGLVSLALSRSVLAVTPWAYLVFFLARYDSSKRILMVALAVSLVATIGGAFGAYVSRMRVALLSGQREVKAKLHRRWQRVLSGPLDLDEAERAQLEAIGFVRDYVRQKPAWPVELQGLAKVVSSLLVAVAPALVSWLLGVQG